MHFRNTIAFITLFCFLGYDYGFSQTSLFLDSILRFKVTKINLQTPPDTTEETVSFRKTFIKDLNKEYIEILFNTHFYKQYRAEYNLTTDYIRVSNDSVFFTYKDSLEFDANHFSFLMQFDGIKIKSNSEYFLFNMERLVKDKKHLLWLNTFSSWYLVSLKDLIKNDATGETKYFINFSNLNGSHVYDINEVVWSSIFGLVSIKYADPTLQAIIQLERK